MALRKPKIAIVRGKFLNAYEMQFFEPLIRDFDITAFGSLTCYHCRFAFPVVKLLSPMDLPEFSYKMPILNRLFVDAHYLWDLEEKLKDFDLVHTAETYYHYTQQALNAKKKSYVKKVIATVLENIPFNNEGIWGRKRFKERARRELDHIIALTNKTKEALLAEGTDPAKITVIGHFVDTKRFHPRRFPELKKPQFRESQPTILFVGRLEEYKGVFDLLEAAAMLRRDPALKSYHLRFKFVGDGSRKQAMLAREHSLGLSHFVTHASVSYSDMPQVYQEADIFVAPSKARIGFSVRGWIDRTRKSRSDLVTWEEQYNTALLEAQASGLPIVTTKSGGIPENVGDAAVLVAPGDVEALTSAIKSFVTDPQKRVFYSKKARMRATTVHDTKIGASKLASIYRMILSI